MESIRIGKQEWTLNNLDKTSFENGDELFTAKTSDEWLNAYYDKKPAYCIYDNNELFGIRYGVLYNWFAIIDNRQLAPNGWHIPHVLEVVQMLNELDKSNSLDYTNFVGDNKFFGQNNVAGGKLKSEGTERWKSPNEGATNETGFSALPGGCIDSNGNFFGVNQHSFFWTKSEDERNNAYFLGLNNYDKSAVIMPNKLSFGFSVRCIRDE